MICAIVSPVLFLPPAIPEFHKNLSLMSFWTKCTGPTGVYHTSADKMIKQLDVTFATAVNEECPGLAETGKSLKKIYPQINMDLVESVLYRLWKMPICWGQVLLTFGYISSIPRRLTGMWYKDLI